MAFQFTLRAVLRFRESFERRERLRLEVITREVVKAKQQRDQALQGRQAAQGELQLKLRQGITGVEMQFELAADRTRLRRIAALNEQVAKLDALRRRQLEVFHKAQQQRKIMENLRDRQLATYRLEQGRKAQQQMDDRFLVTHGRQGGQES